MGCVLIVVLVSMFYALQRIRNDNPIDAIRMENTEKQTPQAVPACGVAMPNG